MIWEKCTLTKIVGYFIPTSWGKIQDNTEFSEEIEQREFLRTGAAGDDSPSNQMRKGERKRCKDALMYRDRGKSVDVDADEMVCGTENHLHISQSACLFHIDAHLAKNLATILKITSFLTVRQ